MTIILGDAKNPVLQQAQQEGSQIKLKVQQEKINPNPTSGVDSSESLENDQKAVGNRQTQQGPGGFFLPST